MNRFNRKEVITRLTLKAKTVCNNVYSSRPSAKIADRMKEFIVVKISEMDPYADTHNIAYAQFICYTKDKQEGIENINASENLIDGIVNLLPFDDGLISCNCSPVMLDSKPDGMGYHATIIQQKLVIKL